MAVAVEGAQGCVQSVTSVRCVVGVWWVKVLQVLLLLLSLMVEVLLLLWLSRHLRVIVWFERYACWFVPPPLLLSHALH